MRPPRDTDLCGAWWCRAEKLQQQPQHWQSLHPRRGHTAPATPRVTRVTRVPALTCCVAHAMLHPGLLGLYCRHQLVSPAACPPLALLRRHGRDTPKVACREHQRYTYTHTAHITCHTVTLHWYWYCTIQMIVTYTVTHPWPAVHCTLDRTHYIWSLELPSSPWYRPCHGTGDNKVNSTENNMDKQKQ